MIKSLKKCLRNCYIKNPDGFERGIKNSIVVMVLLVCMFLVGLLAGCDGKASDVKIYEVKTSGVTYRTQPENHRVKEAVLEGVTYLIVEGGV